MAKLAIKSDNRKQNLLLPPSLDELVPEILTFNRVIWLLFYFGKELCLVGVVRFWRRGDYVSIKFSNFVGY